MMRFVLIPLSIAIVAVVVAAAASIGFARHDNHVALERAYAMMSDSDQLKVNESTLEDVLQFVRKYRGDERSSKPTGTCQPSDCMAETNVSPSFYGRHTWLTPVVKRIGVQVFEFNVTLWVEDGKLTAVEEIFFVPRSVGADVYVVTMTGNPAERNCRHPSYQLHPGFMTSYRERYATPEFTYWTNARRPQEAPPRPRNEPQLRHNDGGMPVYRPILPAAWIQHQADQPKIEALQRTTRAANDSEARCK